MRFYLFGLLRSVQHEPAVDKLVLCLIGDVFICLAASSKVVRAARRLVNATQRACVATDGPSIVKLKGAKCAPLFP